MSELDLPLIKKAGSTPGGYINPIRRCTLIWKMKNL